MKLIKELVNYIVEESDGKKTMFIEGPFLVYDQKNRNGRLYEKHILSKEVNRYMEDYVKKNRAFGELGHPETPTINLERVSHMITLLQDNGKHWVGRAKILETPMGNIAKNLIDGGAQLGVSSRGMGSLVSKNGVNIVQPDFHLATAADIVADPSAPGAFVQGIMEGKEWMLVNNVWTEVHLEEAKQEIVKASRKDIERVSLHIFENFLRKL
jgi:hypothetical protein